MKYYVVVSQEGLSRSSDWYEPPEPFCDVVYVKARNKKAAKVAGVRKMRQDGGCEVIHDYDCPWQAIAQIEEVSWAEYFQYRGLSWKETYGLSGLFD